MRTESISADHPNAIAHALDVLRHGGLVAFPTDTVYGLAALAFEEAYIESLYTAKGRSSSKAIGVLLGDLKDLNKVTCTMNVLASRLAQHFWPGPLTLVVERHPFLPSILAPDDTIGVRMPNHPFALGLMRQSGPLAVTSANLSGQANPLTAQDVTKQLDGRIHLILDGGPTPGGVPSTVVDCTGAMPRVLRPGPISIDDILTAQAGTG